MRPHHQSGALLQEHSSTQRSHSLLPSVARATTDANTLMHFNISQLSAAVSKLLHQEQERLCGWRSKREDRVRESFSVGVYMYVISTWNLF